MVSRLILLALLSLAADATNTVRADCTCRLMGRSVELGTVTCLKATKGYELARCEMTLNVTNWTFLGESCTTSQRDGGDSFEAAGESGPHPQVAEASFPHH